MTPIRRALSSERGRTAGHGGLAICIGAVVIFAVMLLMGCASAGAAKVRNDHAARIVDRQRADATTQFSDDTRQLLWSLEYRLGNAAKVYRQRAQENELRYRSELATAEGQEAIVAVVNAHRDRMDALNTEYRAAVETHVAWAQADGTTKYRNFAERLERAQGVVDLNDAANSELDAQRYVIDGIKESTEFKTLIDLIREKAKPWIDETGADVLPAEEPKTEPLAEGDASK